MKITVTEKDVMITELSQVNQGEFNVNICEFVLPDSFRGLCVTAVFNGIPMPVADTLCTIPPLPTGNCVLGVYAYREKDGEAELVYSPKPTVFYVEKGSFTEDIKGWEMPGIFDFEKYCALLRDYWLYIIRTNTLPEYTEDATELQYYSAKALNGMYHMLQGELEELSQLLGEEE